MQYKSSVGDGLIKRKCMLDIWLIFVWEIHWWSWIFNVFNTPTTSMTPSLTPALKVGAYHLCAIQPVRHSTCWKKRYWKSGMTEKWDIGQVLCQNLDKGRMCHLNMRHSLWTYIDGGWHLYIMMRNLFHYIGVWIMKKNN